jgi:hypothetical protein
MIQRKVIIWNLFSNETLVIEANSQQIIFLYYIFEPTDPWHLAKKVVGGGRIFNGKD